MKKSSLTAIVPAAGIGLRMKVNKPKQYLEVLGRTILEHTVRRLLSHPLINSIVVAVRQNDEYFNTLEIATQADVFCVEGSNERSGSVLNALSYVIENRLSTWVLVHDAVRPCLQLSDVSRLIKVAVRHPVGAILATPVRDTIKKITDERTIGSTVDRTNLWCALTPQMFRAEQLRKAISRAQLQKITVTDEAAAMEILGLSPQLVFGRVDNIKVTQPEDLTLVELLLRRRRTKQE